MSSLEQDHEPTSPVSKNHEPTSPAGKKHVLTSPLNEDHVPASRVNEDHVPASPVNEDHVPASPVNEEPRGRVRTRAALISAARELVFERGHDRISIQDITSRADVGTGTFYNYFETKQEVFEAVAGDYLDQFSSEIEATRQRLKDPAMLIATTLRYYFNQAQQNESWRRFLSFSGLPNGHSLKQPAEQALADLQQGIRMGRFKVEDVYFTQNLIAGMVDHTNREISRGNLAPDATDETVRYILRMLGLPDLVAKALTQNPMPPVAASHRVPAVVGSGNELTGS